MACALLWPITACNYDVHLRRPLKTSTYDEAYPCFASTPSRSVSGMGNTERIRPPWWLKYANNVMIGLQRLGVAGDRALAGRCPVFRFDSVNA